MFPFSDENSMIYFIFFMFEIVIIFFQWKFRSTENTVTQSEPKKVPIICLL